MLKKLFQTDLDFDWKIVTITIIINTIFIIVKLLLRCTVTCRGV